MSEQPRAIDSYILDAVQHVRNRYGVGGLEDLIGEAERELAEAREALAQLNDED